MKVGRLPLCPPSSLQTSMIRETRRTVWKNSVSQITGSRLRQELHSLQPGHPSEGFEPGSIRWVSNSWINFCAISHILTTLPSLSLATTWVANLVLNTSTPVHAEKPAQAAAWTKLSSLWLVGNAPMPWAESSTFYTLVQRALRKHIYDSLHRILMQGLNNHCEVDKTQDLELKANISYTPPLFNPAFQWSTSNLKWPYFVFS